MRNRIEEVMKVLKSMDEKQLLAMFHDMEDIEAVERIADCAYHFTENYEAPDQECESADPCPCNKSDEQDWKDQDDAQRYRDIQSENKRPY